MKFKSSVWRGNMNGAGFIRLPKEFYRLFKPSQTIKVSIFNYNNLAFYSTIGVYKQYYGFYVPKDICKKNDLIGKYVKVKIAGVTGFYSRLSNDGRLYIPRSVAEKFKLNENDIVEVIGNFLGKQIKKYCKINIRKRSRKKEYSCTFFLNYQNRDGVFLIKWKFKKRRLPAIFKFLNTTTDYRVVDNKCILIFSGKHKYVILNPNVRLNKELAFYLGCYFADGTKSGNSWGITSSTFNQANFYLSMHRKLILNNNPHSYISITSKSPPDDKKLKEIWEKKSNFNIENIRKRMPRGHSLKTNTFGSLVIREYSKLIQIFYNNLLNYCIQKILKEKDKNLAFEFILGVMEGDGSPSANSHGHITISTNNADVNILQKILKIAKLDFHIATWKNKCSIRIKSLSILKNIQKFAKIFKLYPKRRKKFIERFCNIGTVKFILGKQNYCSSWVKAWLKKEGILNKEYKLTRQGLKIRNILEDMIKGCDELMTVP